MKIYRLLLVFNLLFLPFQPVAAQSDAVLIGFDGAFGLANSTSATAIERGILIAIDEINRSGGVLDGRPLTLVSRDNRSMTARGIRNLKDFNEMPDMVAMFVGRFSPVALEYVGLAHGMKMILLDPWAAADAIINNGFDPNFAFRLSLKDSLAMPAMLQHTLDNGARRIGLITMNSSWGRSNFDVANQYRLSNSLPEIVGMEWYQRGDQGLLQQYQRLRAAGAEAIVLVANDREAVILCREVASLPANQRLPIVSHWGVTGGTFASQLGTDLDKIDFSVVQTFSFFNADPKKVERVMAVSARLFGIDRFEALEASVGIAHAYDLTHLLARAINHAGTTDRAAIRDALEQSRDYDGLVRYFQQPFSADNHDALDASDVFMARYRTSDGVLLPIRRSPGQKPE